MELDFCMSSIGATIEYGNEASSGFVYSLAWSDIASQHCV